MGPDCGTAVVGGVGLGFANVVAARARSGWSPPPAPARSSCCPARRRRGRRDRRARRRRAGPVRGGRRPSARAALAALDADPGTELIVSSPSRPPRRSPRTLRASPTSLRTPVQFAFVGPGRAGPHRRRRGSARRARRAGPGVAALAGRRAARPAPGALRGLFAGGTLCDEAMVDRPPSGSATSAPTSRCARSGASARGSRPTHGHVMIDFGDDEFTGGRPHPMIDPTLRLERLAAEAADPADRGAAARRRAGPRRAPRPGRRLAPAIARRAGERSGRGGRRVAVRHGRRPAGPGPAGRGPARRRGARLRLQRQAARLRVRLVPGAGHDRAAAPRARPSSPPGVDLLADAPRRSPCGHHGRLAPADGGHRGRASRRAGRPPPGRGQRAGRASGCSRPAPSWSTCCPPGTRWGCGRATSCTPARRSTGPARRARCGARSSGRWSSRAWPPTRRPQRRWPQRGEFTLDALPRTAMRSGPMAGVVSPSMWVFELEDPRPGAGLLLAQRGPGQGAALRRVLGPR